MYQQKCWSGCETAVGNIRDFLLYGRRSIVFWLPLKPKSLLLKYGRDYEIAATNVPGLKLAGGQ
jgi:hypothetical protein